MSNNLMCPCIDYCYNHFGKQYSEDCDFKCDYARLIRKNKQLEKENEFLIKIADRTMDMIEQAIKKSERQSENTTH